MFVFDQTRYTIQNIITISLYELLADYINSAPKVNDQQNMYRTINATSLGHITYEFVSLLQTPLTKWRTVIRLTSYTELKW